ncbi:hypothetical protein [Nannocystis bainbridge]|uniref:DNA topoisomerase (ATP-hydrolyzing) n=1 Tax=Nannocystis bainbridge TaxID=2995303 RepID=A0ABT5DZR3_9BACT|nr:hypothetical protein [Nannocystis bainbridge]MDC0719074.1 hypothetical protein [Nannocystis bainbridge]
MTDEHCADAVQILSLREVVRKRPAMYVGGTDEGTGPLHLLLDVLAGAVELAVRGRCTRIDIVVEADDHITVADDGPGIPAAALVDLLEVPAGRTRGELTFLCSDLPLAVALCDPLEIDTVHAGEQASVVYAAGLQRAPVRVAPAARSSGTRIRFRPDPHIFQCTRVPRAEAARRLADLAFVLPAVSLSWTFAEPRVANLADRVRVEVGASPFGVAHHHGAYGTGERPIAVEVALAWRAEPRGRPPQIHAFANLRPSAGGQHVLGVAAGVRRFLKARGDRGLHDLVAAVAVQLTDPRFRGASQSVLLDAGVRAAVKQATLIALMSWAVRDPEAVEALHRRTRAR